MNVLRLSVIAALPLWLASCSTGIDLMGERQLESDEFYLSGAEPHTGDAAIDQARYGQWMEEVDEFNDADFDDPYAGNATGRSNSQLWNRYTPGWSNGFGSGFGNPYGYGNPYGSVGMGTGGFGSSYGMGQNNMAFMNGYDAWGNPIGGFGNAGFGYGSPYGMGGYGGNGWGYDPWGGGYWGTPGGGYYGGSGYGYHPYYGNMGAYGNNCCGNFSNGSDGGSITFTPPRPRPSLGQFNGTVSGAGSGSGGQAGDSAGNQGTPPGVKPNVSRTTDRANAQGKRDENNSPRTEAQRLRSDREAAERAALDRQRAIRNSERLAKKQKRNQAQTERKERVSSGNSWSRDVDNSESPEPRQQRTSPSQGSDNITPSPSRGSTRPTQNNNSRPSAPRPSNSRSGSSRGGRGG